MDSQNNIFNLPLDFVKDIDGSIIKNIIPSEDGIYNEKNNSITWSLNSIPCILSFDFYGINNIFTGTVYVKVKINN